MQQRNNNSYWNNGAYCENCGMLTGNVINNGIQPIWHPNCKPGCNSVWYDQDPMTDDDEDEDDEQEQEQEQELDVKVCDEELVLEEYEKEEWRHPYHEDDEELEREAREEYRKEMEAQEREEDEREEREWRESRYGYYDTEDYERDD